jgi:hypothetical protein
VKDDEMGRACKRHGEKRNAYRVSVGKTEGKTPLGRRRRRWEDNIKMDLGEIDRVLCTEFTWLRIRTTGGFL